MIAVDTNLLVYAHRGATPEHGAARAAIGRAASAAAGWGIAVPCIAEFWTVVTHPAAKGRPSTPREAQEFLEVLARTARMRIWLPSAGFGRRISRVAVSRGITGPRIFDLQIGLIASENGATEIWTHDGGFMAPPGLRVVDPIGS